MAGTIAPRAARPVRRRRWRRAWLGLPVLLVAGYLTVVACVDALRWAGADRRYREAVALADRLDPGWRADDLERARADVADAENSAPIVRRVSDRVTAWPMGRRFSDLLAS